METEYKTLREKISADKAERLKRYAEFELLVTRAYMAGLDAGVEAAPVPVDVIDLSNRELRWRLDDGACGFAWVTVRPANSSFAKWAVQKGIMRKAYGGGVQLWVSEFGQSIDRKHAFAVAYASVLQNAGINSVANSRLD